jgi:hypothetical protein
MKDPAFQDQNTPFLKNLSAVEDPEMAELAQEEIAELTAESQNLEEKMRLMLLPKDPLDERNIMLEVSARPEQSALPENEGYTSFYQPLSYVVSASTRTLRVMHQMDISGCAFKAEWCPILDRSFVQVRAGTGGGEAALWAAELLRMYTKYAGLQNWKVNVINSNAGEGGGVKEAVIQVCIKDFSRALKVLLIANGVEGAGNGWTRYQRSEELLKE